MKEKNDFFTKTTNKRKPSDCESDTAIFLETFSEKEEMGNSFFHNNDSFMII